MIAAAQLMVILDATITNIALPSIQSDLDVSDANLAWVVNSYALAFGGLLLLGGRAGTCSGGGGCSVPASPSSRSRRCWAGWPRTRPC
ncbi:hypothetical protein NKH77_19130 [Streptomyces sp. M19]